MSTSDLAIIDELASAQDFYSDFYKDVHGFRPRFATEEEWNSIAWLDEQIADLRRQNEVVEKERAADDVAAIAAFEALVATTIAAGAKTRETAVRWLKQAVEIEGDEGFFEYTHRLPYGYLAKARAS